MQLDLIKNIMKYSKGVTVTAAIAAIGLTLTTVHLYPNLSETLHGIIYFQCKISLHTLHINFSASIYSLEEVSNGSSTTLRMIIRAPTICERTNCREFLSANEQQNVKKCKEEVSRAENFNGRRINDSDCKFLPQTSRHPVALVSARGSGNTWTRGLLERASGICTGFLHCDTVMRANGYVGETVKSGKVLVVKTHSTVPKWKCARNRYSKSDDADYGSAILILRNPVHSAIAEWNRRSAEFILGKHNRTIHQERHTYVVPESLFRTKEWDQFLKDYLNDWKTRLRLWVIEQDEYPVHILRYENLKKNTLHEIEETLDFLGVFYDHNTLADRLKDDYSEFHRSHEKDNFEHYTSQQKLLLSKTLLDTMMMAEKAGKSSHLRLDEYLATLYY